MVDYSVYNKMLETDRKIKNVLTSEQKNNKEELKKFIPGFFDQRGVQHLVHFTPIENLPSIIKYGLVPISQQNQKGIFARRVDGNRLECMTDCTDLSISFPNYKMIYSIKLVNYVILKISPSILNCDDRNVFFFSENAAGYTKRLPKDEYCFQTKKSLERMFAEKLFFQDNKSTRTIQKIDCCYTSDPQAEILVSEVIPLEYILEICVDSEQRAQELSQNLIRVSHPPIVVNKSMFSYRQDYKFWQKGQEYGTENVL